MPPSPYLAMDFGAPPNPTQQTATPIGGQLPFEPSGNPFSQDLGAAYQSAYNTALGQNQANYSNILSGYQQTLAQQTQAQDAIGKGYSSLYNQVLGGIQGIGQSQSQAIQDAYRQQSGSAQQDLINRGLGNSTVLSSVQRGIDLDKSKADIALANQIAQLNAGYQSQLGGAGLNYANQAAMQNAAQQNAQLQWMNSVTAQYPNGQLYNQMAQQQGAAQQSGQNRQQAADQFQQQKDASQAALGRAGGGGSLAPNYPAAPNLGPMNPGGSGGYAGPIASITPFGGLGGGSGGGMVNPNFSTPGSSGGWGQSGWAGYLGADLSQAYAAPPGSVAPTPSGSNLMPAYGGDWSLQGWADYAGASEDWTL